MGIYGSEEMEPVLLQMMFRSREWYVGAVVETPVLQARYITVAMAVDMATPFPEGQARQLRHDMDFATAGYLWLRVDGETLPAIIVAVSVRHGEIVAAELSPAYYWDGEANTLHHDGALVGDLRAAECRSAMLAVNHGNNNPTTQKYLPPATLVRTPEGITIDVTRELVILTGLDIDASRPPLTVVSAFGPPTGTSRTNTDGIHSNNSTTHGGSDGDACLCGCCRIDDPGVSSIVGDHPESDMAAWCLDKPSLPRRVAHFVAAHIGEVLVCTLAAIVFSYWRRPGYN